MVWELRVPGKRNILLQNVSCKHSKRRRRNYVGLSWAQTDVVGKEPGAQSSREERICHLAGGRTQVCCVLAKPIVSPIPTVSPGNKSLAASTSEAVRKEGELPSAGQVPEASLVSTWCLCVPLCPFRCPAPVALERTLLLFPHVA